MNYLLEMRAMFELVCAFRIFFPIISTVDLVEVEWGDVGWIGLAEDRDRWRALVNSVLKLRVP
jgi:hypothetical protein